MIYTITLNPAIDYVMSYEEPLQGVQKSGQTNYLPGGKGINASIILNNLGLDNKAIIQADGLLGLKLEKLIHNLNIDYLALKAGGETRLNVKSNFLGQTYELNSEGIKVNFDKLNDAFKKIIPQIKKEDFVLIMGSIPPGISNDEFKLLIKQIYDQGAKLVFDIDNDILKSLLAYKPELIKPNLKELSILFKTKIENKKQALFYGQKLLAKGAKRVLISLDKKGSLYLEENQSFEIKGLKIKELNGSGAGDSMIAAFVSGLVKNYTLEKTLKLAAGAGTATAASIGIAKEDKIEFYRKKIKIIGGIDV